ncbi:two-component system sensor histidine kinase CreC [Iodobacter sp. LRB]|uniref:two-component system sensor histidine kinase CreC n=1 Tax=unclassified Iodobacter TaxID=235634 RepID=UPI000C0F2D8A|nr:two-component system sensor histidine kinase CreC [Iodobacter sp. BJB302]PHV02294.1 two-component system sensor histidine kinase CreC [Iodobacter sp. BJB302]
MRFSLRIFFGYFLLVSLLAAYVLSLVRDEIKPAVRQSSEEVLVDTANLLAELIQPDFVAGRLDAGRFAKAIKLFAERNPQAKVWGVPRDKTFLRVYVTDAQGKVIMDSTGQALGQDYSQWRDVYLTLRGQYGARSSLADPKNELSTVMHVAAPITKGTEIVGVLTVARPNWAMQPFIDRSENKLWRAGLLLLAIGLVIGALFSWWLSRGINKLTGFALAVSEGQAVPVPAFTANRELTTLATALGTMRERLEGKAYIENYVHDLTHELKSPLAGIRGAAEILFEEGLALKESDHSRFTSHIRQETARMQQIVDRLLQLATLEARHGLKDAEPVDIAKLLDEVINALSPQAGTQQILHAPWHAAIIHGEAFLLAQAIRNLLQNALDFTPEHGQIHIELTVEAQSLHIAIHNQGEPIPDYALTRLFERFYSLPRPATGQKSTGLGLALTRTILELHGGSVSLANHAEGGVVARVCLPLG